MTRTFKDLSIEDVPRLRIKTFKEMSVTYVFDKREETFLNANFTTQMMKFLGKKLRNLEVIKLIGDGFQIKDEDAGRNWSINRHMLTWDCDDNYEVEE